MSLTPQKLFDYATGYAERQEQADHGTQYPTFRQAANRFRVSLQAIEDTIEDWDSSNGYMCAAVGFRTGGNGVAAYKNRGDFLVEAYR